MAGSIGLAGWKNQISMAKMSKAKLSSQGKKIMAIAKKIRKSHPNKKWTTCVKEAGKKYKSGK